MSGDIFIIIIKIIANESILVYAIIMSSYYG